MKKLLLSGVFAAALLANDSEIIDFVKSMVPPNIEVKVTNKQDIGSGFYAYEIGFFQGEKLLQEDLVFSNGMLFTGDLMDMKNKKSFKSDFEKAQREKQQAAAKAYLPEFLKAHKDLQIELGPKDAEEVQVVFSDPRCPFCVIKLGSLEEDIKTKRVIYVMSPLASHGEEALLASMHILSKGMGKSDAEKIALMKRYYDEKQKPEALGEQLVLGFSEKIEALFGDSKLMLRSVPSVFELQASQL